MTIDPNFNGALGGTKEQQLYNEIIIAESALKDTKADLAEKLLKDKRYCAALKDKEDLEGQGGELIQEDYARKMVEVEEEISAAKIEFEAREELEYNRVKNMKETIDLKKEMFVDVLLTNMKEDRVSVIYKEKSNGKKARVQVTLKPQLKVLKGEYISDEELMEVNSLRVSQ